MDASPNHRTRKAILMYTVTIAFSTGPVATTVLKVAPDELSSVMRDAWAKGATAVQAELD